MDAEPTSRIPGRLSDLAADECYRRLDRTGVGRVAICTDDGPVILPVNYLVDGTSIVIRTAPYTSLAEHAVGQMAFEVDRLEPALQFGWSVLVVGQAMPVEDFELSSALKAEGRLQAWAPGPRNLFIRITPRKVTGRDIG